MVTAPRPWLAPLGPYPATHNTFPWATQGFWDAGKVCGAPKGTLHLPALRSLNLDPQL